MKNLLFALLATILLFSCNWDKEQKDFERYFKGNKELRRISQQEVKTPQTFSASYFLFFGSAESSGGDKINYIAFSWKNADGEYVLSKVPIEKTRIKFDENAKTPYITFGYNDEPWVGNEQSVNADINHQIEINIDYIVIHCRESDYSPNINTQNINP